MRLLNRTASNKLPEAPPPCPHLALVARWASIEDMGKPDRISEYLCTACNHTLTVVEAGPYLG
jgi:hypothetical protein